MKRRIYPIGTVVLLKSSTKRLMIIGFYQKTADSPDMVWDYAGCPFPEGYLDQNKVFLFQHDDIARVDMIGYQDEEVFDFYDRLNQL